MGSFSEGMKKSIGKMLSDTNSSCNKLAAEAFNITVRISPTQPDANHAKGQFINNWFPMVDGYDNTVTYDLSFEGLGSLTRIKSVTADSTAFLGKDGFISMSNNLPYALNVEYLGWANPGPYRPVGQTVLFMSSKYSK